MKSGALAIAGLVLSATQPAFSQMLVSAGRAAELLSDLPAQEKNSLRCEILPVPPALTFSFRFQSGFQARVPLQQFHGRGHSLSMLLRVTPGDRQPVYLLRTFELPDVPNIELNAELAGAFLAGIGSYQINAVLFDDLHRNCRGDWRIQVKLEHIEPAKILIAPNQVVPVSLPRSDRPSPASGAAPRLTVFLHAAPLNPRDIRLQAQDVVALTGALSALAQVLPDRTVRLVMFNIHLPGELYRNDAFTLYDLEEVTRALDRIQLGMVDYRALQDGAGQREVLRILLRRERQEATPSDEVVFLGPDGNYGPENPASPDDSPLRRQRFYYLQFQPDGPLFLEPSVARGILDDEPRPEMACQAVSADGGCSPSPAPMAGRPQSAADMETRVRRHGGEWDAIATVVRKLKGKVLVIRTPSDFAKAVERIEHAGR